MKTARISGLVLDRFLDSATVGAGRPAEAGTAPAPIARRASLLGRWGTMSRLALRMAFHDRTKFAAAVIGVVFAVLLSDQQAATFLAIVNRNVMVVDNSDADIWIMPPATEILQPGKLLSQSPLNQARGTPGVAWAEPILVGGATVALPQGGSEQVALIGTRGPAWKGGPFNMVAGSADALAEPDAMIFEDSDREKLGGLNLGTVREVNGRRIKVVGFTWGLVPFGPASSRPCGGRRDGLRSIQDSGGRPRQLCSAERHQNRGSGDSSEERRDG
jgi:hypothetical protein